MADVLRVLLRATTIAVIAMVGWLVWVIVGVLPGRDPASVGLWSVVAVGAACLAIAALLATMGRQNDDALFRVGLAVLSGVAILFGVFVLITLATPGSGGGHFEGYLVLIGSILALEGGLGLGWLLALPRR